MNSTQIGFIAEYQFLLELLKNEYHLAIPCGDTKGYDLVVETKKGWKTIQIKTAIKANVSYKRQTGKRVVMGQRYKKGSFDFLIIVNRENDAYWVFSQDEVLGKWSVYATPDSPAYMDLDKLDK